VSQSAEPVFDPRGILLELADHGVEFTVVGGIAVQVHGHWRNTKDLDVIPAPDLANLSRLGEALAALSARLARADRAIDVGDPHELRRAPFTPVQTDHGRLDILNIGTTAGAPATYDVLRERAIETELDGRVIAIVGLDDLIRMKRVAGRDVDLSDIGALTRTDEQLQEEAGEST
jgi:predicted nucleotidyltransferase